MRLGERDVSSCGVVGGRNGLPGGGEGAYIVSVDAPPRESFLTKKLCARLANDARLVMNVLEFRLVDGS